MGLNEVAIGISPPDFGIELARSRLHPAWLSRAVTTGEMYEPDDAPVAGLLDRVLPPDMIETELDKIVSALRAVHKASHVTAKKRLRRAGRDRSRTHDFGLRGQQPIANCRRVAALVEWI
jgi:enoyl-CoA hydratase